MTEETGPVQPSAKQRLQATRQALMHELVPSTRADIPAQRAKPNTSQADGALGSLAVQDSRALDHASPNASVDDKESSTSFLNHGWFSIARHSVRAWWEFHPARVVGVIAQPVLANYARKRPWKLVGIAAGVGAVVVVTKPWRLVSVGGLAVAALKSSQVSNFALTFLSNRKNNRKTPT